MKTQIKERVSIVWRGVRYWTMEPKPHEVIGWNTKYVPYAVHKTTHKKFIASSNGITVHINRIEIEETDKFYHSRFGEYFYLHRPQPEAVTDRYAHVTAALKVLGLKSPCTAAEVKSAHRRLSKQRHPDKGGSHDAFLEVQRAYEQIMKGV